MQATVVDSTLRVVFDGDLLSTNVAALRGELLGILEKHPGARSIVADIARARVVDSQGLNLLVALLREAERRQAAFRVENVSDELRRLLTLLNLSARFGVPPVSIP